MKKASEYRQHAQECRDLAAKMASPDQREQLLEMARHWDQLARDRAELIARNPGRAQEGERDEETRERSRRPS